ncbi:TetR/AcrR family transcriptional regulator [Spongiactinospora gelatinilytica]|nr:TetR/AcrR family transcriptional regulator [Spongiactinospora gelatinilytica]
MMSPKRVDKPARRQEILEAAVRVFARRGFAASRIEDVAAEAEIAKGSVYLYFDSREEILHAAFEALAAGSREIVGRARTTQAPPLERLAGLIRDVITSVTVSPELARLLLDLYGSGAREEGLPLHMAEIYREYRTAIAALLAEAVAEGSARQGVGVAEATVIVGAIEGCLLQWIIDPALPINELAGPIAALCVSGVR